MTGTHRLVIDRLATRVHPAPGTAPEWAARIDAAMRGPLPQHLGAGIERRFAAMDAVVRIRRLGLRWRPAGDLPDTGQFADFLARRIAEAVGQALATPLPGSSPGADMADIRVWPDRARYAAAWVRHRLGVAPDADWAFPDFAALAVLTGADAAAEVLAQAPEAVFAALARSPDDARAITGALGESAALRVLAARIGSVAPDAGALAVAQDRMPDPAVPPGAEGRAVVAALIAPRPLADPPGGLPRVAQALLARLSLVRFLAAGGDPRMLAQPGLRLPDGVPPVAQAAFAAFARDPELRLWLLRSVPPAQATGPAPPGPTPRRPAAPAPGRVIHSPCAGIALILALCPLAAAPPEVIRRTALDLIPDAARDAALDPGFALLFPADPRADPAPPPAPVVAAWAGLGTLAGAEPRDGFGAHADLWLAAFAARLPGLQASSRGYLAREFLWRPGRIEQGPAHLHITLPPIPLGLVLRMSGLTGQTPVIAHLGMRLLIDLER